MRGIKSILEVFEVIGSSCQQLQVVREDPRFDCCFFHLHQPCSRDHGCDHHRERVPLWDAGWPFVCCPDASNYRVSYFQFFQELFVSVQHLFRHASFSKYFIHQWSLDLVEAFVNIRSTSGVLLLLQDALLYEHGSHVCCVICSLSWHPREHLFHHPGLDPRV